MPPKILVVDDEGIITMMLQMLLEQSIPCTVDTALNGQQALEKALSWQPDLMLLDMRMPGMEGSEVCRRIKEDPRTSAIRVVYVTGYVPPDDGVQCAEGIVSKPIDPEELMGVISRLLPAS